MRRRRWLRIANIQDIKRGGAMGFTYSDKKALLVRTKNDEVLAYVAICPHEGGAVEWDKTINKFLCECHMSLFYVHDGSVYRHSSLFELDQGLTRIDIKVNEDQNIYVV